MREQRPNDIIEIGLDGRQIAGLVSGALVTLAVVFAIGVLFGRQLATTPAGDEKRIDLASLDAAPAPEQKFTFHEQLAKAEPLAPTPKPPPVAATPKPAEPAPAPAPKPAESAPTPDPVAAPTPPPEFDLPPEEPKKVVEAPKPAPPPVVREEPAGWAVQFAASPDRGDADRLAAQLLDYGYAPYVVEADIPGKGRFHRVRVGGFANKEGAERLRREVQEHHRLAGFVMPTR
jgi:DedD protein